MENKTKMVPERLNLEPFPALTSHRGISRKGSKFHACKNGVEEHTPTSGVDSSLIFTQQGPVVFPTPSGPAVSALKDKTQGLLDVEDVQSPKQKTKRQGGKLAVGREERI